MENSIFFWLKTDKEQANVRFLYKSLEDIEVIILHEAEYEEVREDGSIIRKAVTCLGEECPLCKVGKIPRKKIFVPLYNEDTKTVQLWERSIICYSTMLEKIYEKYDDVPSYIFKIIRHGYKGDIHTNYEVTCIRKDESFQPCYIPDIENIRYVTCSLEEMENIIKGGLYNGNSKSKENS